MSKQKNIFSFGAVIMLVGFAAVAHAQTVTNSNNICEEPSATGGDETIVTGILPDGSPLAVTGDYNQSVDCGDYAGTPTCTALTQAIAEGTEDAQVQPGFPQLTGNPSSNNIDVIVQDGACSELESSACEVTTQIINPDGSSNTKASIYINPQVPLPGNSGTLLGASSCQLKSLIEHETGHAFGVGDSYLLPGGDKDPGLMGNGIQNCVTYGTDPLLADEVAKINTAGESGTPLPSNGSCVATCPDGSPVTVDSDGSTSCTEEVTDTETCVSTSVDEDGTVTCNLADGSSCQWSEPDGSDVSCVDKNGTPIDPPDAITVGDPQDPDGDPGIPPAEFSNGADDSGGGATDVDGNDNSGAQEDGQVGGGGGDGDGGGCTLLKDPNSTVAFWQVPKAFACEEEDPGDAFEDLWDY